jgi:tetratricopeptide (TPR) repeat protein
MKSIFLSLALSFSVSLLDIGPGHLSLAGAYELSAIQKSLKEKDYNRVIQLLSPEVEKLDRAGLFALAKAYSSLKKSEAAIKAYTAALSLNPQDVEAKTLIGAEQIISGKEKEALITLKEALEMRNDFVPAYKLLIKIYEKRKNKYELRLLYQDLVEKIGPKSDYLTKLCELTTTDGLYDLAEKYCQQGIDTNSKEPNNYVYLGIARKETGKVKEAEMILKKVADDFSQSALAQNTYAHSQEEKKNFIGAYAYYKKAIAADAKSVPGYVGLAQSSLEIQKYQESLDAFVTACRLDKSTIPTFRRATNTLRTMKIDEWLKKFEKQSDDCGLSSSSSQIQKTSVKPDLDHSPK